MKETKYKIGDEVVWNNSPGRVVAIHDIPNEFYPVEAKSWTDENKGYWWCRFTLEGFSRKTNLTEPDLIKKK